MTKRIISFIFTALCLLTSAFGQKVSGQVFFRDSVLTEAGYILIYTKESRIAVMTDADGRYSLPLNGGDGDSIHVEYSHIGYRAVERGYFKGAKDITADSVILDLQPMMIATAYITPKGKTPAEYILSRVWEKAKENRGKLQNYSASVNYSLSSHDVPLVAAVMPKTMLWAGKMFANVNGFGPIARFCLNNDDVEVRAALNRHVIGGDTHDRDNHIVSSNVRMDAKTEECFKSMFGKFDLFNLLYGYEGSWIRRFTKHNEFELIGTYEYGDKLVDILRWKSEGRLSAMVHVVEEDWGILKIQINFGPEALRCEARDLGNGIYMPVNLAISPGVTMIPADKIPRAITIVKNMKTINKKTKERAVKLLESYIGRDFNPYMVTGFNIRYDSIR